MQTIPLTAVPAQSFAVHLAGQDCDINLYQKSTGLFFDLTLDSNPVVTAMICRDRVGLVRSAYLGFQGQLAFADMQGASDPYYTGLGSRYVLIYTP